MFTLVLVAAIVLQVAGRQSDNQCAWQLSYRWEAEVGGTSNWSPLLSNGKLYAVHTEKGVSSVDQATGDVVWTYDNNAVVGGCALSLGKIILPTTNSIISLDSRTGELKEHFDTDGTPCTFGAPLIVNGLVVFGTTTGKVYAISSMTLRQVWVADLGSANSIVAGASVWRNSIVVGSLSGNLFLLKKSDGSIQSSFTSPGISGDEGIQTGIAVDGDVAYYAVSAVSTDIFAVNLATMKQTWAASLSTDFYAYSTPVFSNGMLYTTSYNGKVFALEPADGKVKFTLDTYQEIKVRGPLVVTEDLLIVATNSGTLIGFDSITGARGFSFRSGAGLASAPTVNGNSIFVAGSEFLFELETTCRTR